MVIDLAVLVDSLEPEQCLDWIFANISKTFYPVATGVVKFLFKEFAPGNWPTASDHYPVQAVFHLNIQHGSQ